MLPIWTAITLSILSAAGPERPGDAAAEIKALEGKMEALKRDVRDPLRKEYERRREALSREADLNPLRFDVARAKKTYEMRLAGDPVIVAARRAAEQLEKAIPGIIKARVEGDPRVLAATREIEALRAVRPQIDSMRQKLRRQLSEVRRQLRDSPAIRQARQGVEAAERAYQEFAYKHPKAVAARQAREAARQALEAATRGLPERKAYEQAERAYEQLKEKSPDLAQARRRRDAARKAYEQKLQAAIAASAKGVAIQQEIQQSEQREQQAEATQREVRKQLYAVREEVGKSPELKALRQAVAAAEKAYYEAYRNGPKIAAARKARDDASAAYSQNKTEQAKRALEEADRIYQGLKQTDPDIVRTRAAREAAGRAYGQKLEQAVRASEKGAAVYKQIEEARRIVSQANETQRELRRKLYALREEVGKSAQLAADRQAVQAVEKAYYELPRTHPTFVAARKARDEARRAMEEKMRTLPQRKAVEAAERAYEYIRRESPEAKQARAARDQASRAYESRIEQLLRASGQGAAIYQQIAQLERQRDEGERKRRELTQSLYRLRRDIERKDPTILEARKAAENARKEYYAAVKRQVGDEQKAVYEATRALEKHLERKVAEDVFVQDIRERLKDVERQIEDLAKQSRDLRHQAGGHR